MELIDLIDLLPESTDLKEVRFAEDATQAYLTKYLTDVAKAIRENNDKLLAGKTVHVNAYSSWNYDWSPFINSQLKRICELKGYEIKMRLRFDRLGFTSRLRLINPKKVTAIDDLTLILAASSCGFK